MALKEKLHARIDKLRTRRIAYQQNMAERERRRLERAEALANLDTRIDRPMMEPDTPAQSSNGAMEVDMEESMEHVEEEAALHQETEGKFEFGKLKFGKDDPNQKRRNLPAKKALKMIERKKERIQKLMVVDPEKAEKLEMKEAWKRAELLAAGAKIRDDPQRLKKAIKLQEKAKEKSQQQWFVMCGPLIDGHY